MDRIEAKGLVERVQCPGDRRSLNVQLTAAGREMLDEMWPVYARGIAEDFLPALGSNAYEMGQRLEQIGRECEVVNAAEGEEGSEGRAELDDSIRVAERRAVADQK
jgi:DNA-binding MarR family transcriptional regulator